MRTKVLLALGPCAWDAEFVKAASALDSGLEIVRRCTDVTELLHAATDASGATALIGDSVPRLSPADVRLLKSGGTPVIGLHEAGSEEAGRRLRDIGIADLLPIGADVPAALRQLVGLLRCDPVRPHLYALADSPETTRHAMVAVWGPPGAPGRTSVAVALADECARAGRDTLLIDADALTPSIAAVLGLCDDVPTIEQAVRRAERGEFTASHLVPSLSRVGSRLRLLAGAATPAVPAAVWEAAAAAAELVVVDVGAAHEVASSALAAASLIVGVGAGEPINLARFVTSWPAVVAAYPNTATQVVITRVRRSAVGGPQRTLEDLLAEHGIGQACFVPDDRNAYDAAILSGRTLAEAAPDSVARQVLRNLAAGLPNRLGLGERVLELTAR